MPRLKPDREGKILQVTKNRTKVLKALTRYGILNMEHVSAIVGASYHQAAYTTRSMKEANLIGWTRWTSAPSVKGSSANVPINPPHIFCLAPRGKYVAIKRGLIDKDAPTFTPSWKGNALPLLRADHDLKVISFLLSLEKQVKASGKLVIEFAMTDTITESVPGPKRKIILPAITETLPSGKKKKPDAVIVLRNTETGKATVIYFELENYSRPSQIARAVPEKLKDYLTLFKMPERRFNQGPPLLLYATADPSRARKIFAHEEARPLFPRLRAATIADASGEPLTKEERERCDPVKLGRPLDDVWNAAAVEKGKIVIRKWGPLSG
jgi:hypothetical protein